MRRLLVMAIVALALPALALAAGQAMSPVVSANLKRDERGAVQGRP